MSRISFNSIPTSVFKVNAEGNGNAANTRARLIGAGRLLMTEFARKGVSAIHRANNSAENSEAVLSTTKYKELNEKFGKEHLLYAVNRVCQSTGETAPSNFEEFKAQSLRWYGDEQLYRVMQGIYTEIIIPILPATYSESVSYFADVVEVGFGETYSLTIESNDIPVFQDAAWGAQRSVPANRFYAKDVVLNPTPKTAYVKAKWAQMLSNNMDWGKWLANLTAGLYGKTLALWNAQMVAAASDTTLVPTGLTYTFSSLNWVTLADKLAALNHTTVDNIIAYGGAVPLAKVLPKDVTGSTNVDMDAAIAALVGEEFLSAGYLGQYYRVRLMPLQNAIVPNTLNTVLDNGKIWMLAGNAHKPLTIAYNSATPLTLEIDPMKSGDMEMGINLTIALDSVAVFADKVGLITI